jgi:hypothetical protein
VKCQQRDSTEGNYMAAAENSRMLRVVASVPVLSFPPPPKPLPLGFHRAHLSQPDNSKQSGFLKDDFNLFWLRDALADQH